MAEYKGIGNSRKADARVTAHQIMLGMGRTSSTNNQKTVATAAQQPKIQPMNATLLRYSYQTLSGQSMSSFPAAVSSMISVKYAEGAKDPRSAKKARLP